LICDFESRFRAVRSEILKIPSSSLKIVHHQWTRTPRRLAHTQLLDEWNSSYLVMRMGTRFCAEMPGIFELRCCSPKVSLLDVLRNDLRFVENRGRPLSGHSPKPR
jgi:hypothetical protein